MYRGITAVADLADDLHEHDGVSIEALRRRESTNPDVVNERRCRILRSTAQNAVNICIVT
jgi:hypothetical protein